MKSGILRRTWGMDLSFVRIILGRLVCAALLGAFMNLGFGQVAHAITYDWSFLCGIAL
jgi:hypothetical protein